MRVLFVCLGNICRSPLAQGILSDIATKEAINIEVESAGTAAYHVGEAPDHRSIAIAKKYGIDISKQRSQQIKPSDLETFDFVFAMDETNLKDLYKLANKHSFPKEHIRLIRSYDPERTYDQNVPDPYYGGEDGFAEVFEMLSRSCNNFVKKEKLVY
jgi:protein-tyrosine phosphatase